MSERRTADLAGIDVDVIPCFGAYAFKLKFGKERKVLSQAQFEQLMARGESALRDGDLMLRKRMGAK